MLQLGVCIHAFVIHHAKRNFSTQHCIIIWSVWLYHIFSRCPINSMIFRQELLNIKCVFWFSLQIFAWNIPHSKKNSARYYHKCTRYFLPINETRIFSTEFRKILKYQISWRSVQWEQSCSMWTGWRRS